MADYYSQENHGPFHLFEMESFDLEEGGRLRNCKLAYATHGTLSRAKDNVVLMPTWYSGTSKIMEQLFIGPGRALDPAHWFIVVVNQIGSGLGSSPHNTPAPFNGPRFPHVRIGDDVEAQRRLLAEKFGVEQIALVCGGSMGAQQTYEWAVRFPGMVRRAAPIAGTARNTPHDFIYGAMVGDTIKSDPAWNGGWYRDSSDVHEGLRRQAQLWSLMGLCPEFYKREIWRSMGFSSVEDFTVGFIEGYFLPMDPNDLLCQAWKWQRGDVARHTRGDLKAALGRIKAKTFVMPISSDMFFPVQDCADEQALIPGSELRVIESHGGHFGLFGFEPGYIEQLDGHLRDLLAS